MRCNVYPAKKNRTVSTALLRKIAAVLIGFFGLTCRRVPPRAAQPGYLPVPATAEAAPPEPPDPMWREPVPWVLPGMDLPKIRLGIEGALKLLGVDLAVLVQDMGIHAGNHVNLRMARVALGGLQVAVVQFQLVGGAGMTEGMKDHPGQPCLLPQLLKLLQDEGGTRPRNTR